MDACCLFWVVGVCWSPKCERVKLCVKLRVKSVVVELWNSHTHCDYTRALNNIYLSVTTIVSKRHPGAFPRMIPLHLPS